MIRIHATKKLLAKLPFDEQGLLPNHTHLPEVRGTYLEKAESPLSGWHANLITLQRRNCIVMVHDLTRFPIIMIGLKKEDFANLEWHFQDALMNTFLKTGFSHSELDQAARLLRRLQFDTTSDRSVQGTVNRVAGEMEHIIWSDNLNIMDVSPYRLGAHLSEYCRSVKGQKDYVFPQQAMRELLQ